MKKNFFATLIIVVLTLIMSFTLTSCDLFNQSNGSGSNGGSRNDNGLDASKLSAVAKNNTDAQELASKIDDDVFKNYKDNFKISVTKEDFANIFAEILNGEGKWNDPYRVYNAYTINYSEDSNIYSLLYIRQRFVCFFKRARDYA